MWLEIKQLTRLQIIRYCEKLEEEILDLKSELSKFSEAYKKYRDYEKEELAESCYDLARENEKLRAEVKGLVERDIELNKKYIFVLSKSRGII